MCQSKWMIRAKVTLSLLFVKHMNMLKPDRMCCKIAAKGRENALINWYTLPNLCQIYFDEKAQKTVLSANTNLWFYSAGHRWVGRLDSGGYSSVGELKHSWWSINQFISSFPKLFETYAIFESGNHAATMLWLQWNDVFLIAWCRQRFTQKLPLKLRRYWGK